LSQKYIDKVYRELEIKNRGQTEFLQAAHEVLTSLAPIVRQDKTIEQMAVLERLVEPDRVLAFRVDWVDDTGKVQLNRGYRVQFNNAIGPYKGGLRFHPTVNLSIMKFLGFEQIFKNSLSGLPLGGGKGGSDFDPKGKSDGEIMRFCQSFMNQLYRYIGQFSDIPAGDIGVGQREIGYLYGQYKKLTNQFAGVLTGKGLEYGGSLVRPEATGYGVCYYADEAMKRLLGDSLDGKTMVISGSGNVAIFAAEKATELGAKVIAMSDSTGFIQDPAGINIALIKKLKLENRSRISDYIKSRSSASYQRGRGIWGVQCDVALPCATQNELSKSDAEKLVKNGSRMVVEGANMPVSQGALEVFRASKVIFGPAKAANGGGVAVSGLEMSQNSQRQSWSFSEIDRQLKSIMIKIVDQSLATAARYRQTNDLASGANILAFEKVYRAMLSQGV
jgi:glutamate dehydrogenase (NADP+)